MPQVRKVQLVPEQMSLSAYRVIFSTTDQHYFPVVDGEDKLTGIFSINDIRSILFDQNLGDLVRMKDVANPAIIYTTPSEDLNEVLKKFIIRNLQRLPVVKDEDPRALIGMLDRRAVIQYYNQRVEEIKAGRKVLDVGSDREITQLKNIPVSLAMRTELETIPADMPLEGLLDFVYKSKPNSFPVVNEEGRLLGILSLSDCQKLGEQNSDTSKTALDIATKNLVTVSQSDNLFVALTRIIQGDFSILPVVDEFGSKKLAGVISRRDIMSAYDNIIIRGLGRE
jgi:CIC family chloride channel protein